MSCGWHAATAQSFIDGLTAQASAKLAAAPGVGVHRSDGLLNREMLLTGPVGDFQTRDRLIADVAAIPGVSDARWSYDADAAPIGSIR